MRLSIGSAINQAGGFGRNAGLGIIGPELGPELITNGLFPVDASGWVNSNSTLSAPSGRLIITANGGVPARATQTFATVVGATYLVSFVHRTISGTSASGAFISVVGTASSYGSLTSDVARTFTFVAAATTSTLVLDVSGTPTNGNQTEFDNVSVRQVYN